MKAWELLSPPGTWIQGITATTIDGRPVAPIALNAAHWCIMGAIIRCYSWAAVAQATIQVRNLIGYDFTVDWNDVPGRTQAEVIEVLKKADV